MNNSGYLTLERFEHSMIFSKLWFAYYKTKQGDMFRFNYIRIKIHVCNLFELNCVYIFDSTIISYYYIQRYKEI